MTTEGNKDNMQLSVPDAEARGSNSSNVPNSLLVADAAAWATVVAWTSFVFSDREDVLGAGDGAGAGAAAVGPPPLLLKKGQ